MLEAHGADRFIRHALDEHVLRTMIVGDRSEPLVDLGPIGGSVDDNPCVGG